MPLASHQVVCSRRCEVTAEQVVERVSGARKTGRGWIARCPVHPDRAPSLSIGNGRDGRLLLRCFAGCDVERIVAGLGLEMRDIFEQDAGTFTPSERKRPMPSFAEIRAELRHEVEAFREKRGIDPGEELLANEVNAIRRHVAGRLGITLAPIARPISDGNYGGRERDPLWKIIFERAWHELWFDRGLEPPHQLADRAPEPADLILVEERTADMMRAAVAR